MPLVRGTRWLLIGDQAQLPAFGRAEIEQLLQKDAELGRTASVTGKVVDPAWREKYLRHFTHLMQTGAASARVVTAVALTRQRRMHPHIGEMIKRAFCGNALEHDPSTERPHQLKIKGLDASAALVWLDTTSLGTAAWERPGLVNDIERKIISWLSRRGLEPKANEAGVPPLAILSPYRAQVKALADGVREFERDAVHTVDSVQGREAEVVVVSLVRNNGAALAREGIGFLEEPERVNVMFSRARRLLLIVGSLEHFERFGVGHWNEIAAYVRSDPRFLVDVRALGFRVEVRDGSA